MKTPLFLLPLLFACHVGDVNSEEGELTPQHVEAYVNILRDIKEPVDYESLNRQLKKIISPDASFREGMQSPGDTQKFYDVTFEDGHKRLRIQFDGNKPHLSMPKLNALTPKRKGLKTCAERPIGFESVRVRDLVKLYGPWIFMLDGAERESRVSLFVFKSGALEINVNGCYEEPKDNIQVHMISVEWPRPEEKHY